MDYGRSFGQLTTQPHVPLHFGDISNQKLTNHTLLISIKALLPGLIKITHSQATYTTPSADFKTCLLLFSFGISAIAV